MIMIRRFISLAAISAALALTLACGGPSLHLACKSGDIKTVEKILSRKNVDINAREKQYGSRPLHWAAGQGHLEIVDLLLQKGADINATDNDNITPLHVAVGKKQKDVVRYLLDKKANPNLKDAKGDTPLQGAVELGQMDVVQLLVDAGADVNAANDEGIAPMDRAFVSGNKPLAQLLWQRGGRPKKGMIVKKPTDETSGTVKTVKP